MLLENLCFKTKERKIFLAQTAQVATIGLKATATAPPLPAAILSARFLLS